MNYIIGYQSDPITSKTLVKLYKNMNYRNRFLEVASGTLETIQILCDELNNE